MRESFEGEEWNRELFENARGPISYDLAARWYIAGNVATCVTTRIVENNSNNIRNNSSPTVRIVACPAILPIIIAVVHNNMYACIGSYRTGNGFLLFSLGHDPGDDRFLHVTGDMGGPACTPV